MAIPFDPSELIGIFSAETKEHLENLNKGVLTLEKQPDNVELVHELMREAHNLKGSAGTLGYTGIQDIAHRIEDIFIAIRDYQFRLDLVVADRIFSGLDTIREISRCHA